MTYKFYYLLGILLIGLTLHVSAYSIEKIGIEQGLSNNNVACIAQDKAGYIWIATKDGLNRFDAYTFKIFKSVKADTNTISSNVLNFVFADKNDDLIWIATEKDGLDSYNYKTNSFTHYRHDNTTENNSSLIENGVTYISSDSKVIFEV
jgi:ligand-binding sensor domain-containing protein